MERRKYPRVKIAERFEVGLAGYSGAEGVRCLAIVDISHGGLRLVTSEAEQPGSQLTLQLLLPGNDEPIQVAGQVVWARRNSPYELGACFVELPREARQLFERLLGPRAD